MNNNNNNIEIQKNKGEQKTESCKLFKNVLIRDSAL